MPCQSANVPLSLPDSASRMTCTERRSRHSLPLAFGRCNRTTRAPRETFGSGSKLITEMVAETEVVSQIMQPVEQFTELRRADLHSPTITPSSIVPRSRNDRKVSFHAANRTSAFRVCALEAGFPHFPDAYSDLEAGFAADRTGMVPRSLKLVSSTCETRP